MRTIIGAIQGMRLLLPRWPWLVVAVMLVTLGWLLHHVLPHEPRWTVNLEEGDYYDYRCYWEPDGKRVRVRSIWTRGRGKPMTPTLVLDMATGHALARVPNVVGDWSSSIFQYSPDGRFEVTAIPEIGKLHWVDFATGETAFIPLEICTDASVSFSPHGHRFLVVSGKNRRGIVEVEALAVYDTATRNEVFRTQTDSWWSAFLGDSRHLIYVPNDNSKEIVLHDLKARQPVTKFPGRRFLVSSDSTRMLCYGAEEASASLWDISDARACRLIAADLGAHGAGSFSPDSRFWTRPADLSEKPWLHSYDARREKAAWALEGSFRQDYAYSPDGRWIGLTSYDRVFHLVECESGKIQWKCPTIPNVLFNGMESNEPSFSPDARKVVVKGDGMVNILDVETGEVLRKIPTPCEWFEKIHVSESGQTLMIFGHNLPERQAEPAWPLNWLDRLTGKKRSQWPDLLSVWDLENFEELFRIDDTWVRNVALAPDGKALLIVEPRGESGDGYRLVCWDLPPRKPWCWIIGIPAGIGASVLAWQWLRRKRRAAA